MFNRNATTVAERSRAAARLGRFATGAMLALGLSGAAGQAHAVAFDTDLTVTGQVNLGTAVSSSGVTQTGETRTTEGETSTTAGFTTTAGAPNPLTGTLTDIGDGFGYSTDLDAAFFADSFQFIIDLGIDLSNGSLTDTFTITFNLVFDGSVDANGFSTGDGSFAQSILSVDNDGTSEFASNILSDTEFGDNDNGTEPNTFGDPISDAINTTFNVMLAPGETKSITVSNEWVGGVFEDDVNGASMIDLIFDLNITNVDCSGPCIIDPGPDPDPIPAPASLPLLAVGLAGLGFARRRMGK